MAWILMFITLGVITLLSQLHPVLAVLGLMLNPFFTAGVYKSVVALQQKQKISYSSLFAVFKEPACRAVFLRLAAFNMLASIPLSSLAVSIIEQQQQGMLELPLVLLFVIGFVLCWMLFAYAVAIAYFLKEQRILAIMQASFVACWRNTTALTVFGLLSLLLIMLTMPTLFAGLLLVVPLLNIAFFLSFNEFFALQINSSDDAMLEV